MNKKEVAQGLSNILEYLSSRDISVVEKICVIGFVLVYVISPIDLIPDVPVIGWLDDIGIISLFVAFCNYRMERLSKNKEAKSVDVTPVDATSQDRNLKCLKNENTFSFHEKNSSSYGVDNDEK